MLVACPILTCPKQGTIGLKHGLSGSLPPCCRRPRLASPPWTRPALAAAGQGGWAEAAGRPQSRPRPLAWASLSCGTCWPARLSSSPQHLRAPGHPGPSPCTQHGPACTGPAFPAAGRPGGGGRSAKGRVAAPSGQPEFRGHKDPPEQGWGRCGRRGDARLVLPAKTNGVAGRDGAAPCRPLSRLSPACRDAQRHPGLQQAPGRRGPGGQGEQLR